ncbi:MAG: PAS domain S-box protein [Gammaproteobacteria bacterium]|nr:PAS domain S-box protein [Gammaproteobacteria bacterium]
MALDAHFVFLEARRNLDTAVEGQYSILLVTLSIVIACLAAYAAFLLSERYHAAQERSSRILMLMIGSIAMGVGIWTMHFTGMLAFQLPMKVSYDKALTLFSILPAIFASSFVLASKSNNTKCCWRLPVQSLLMGVGIGVMHYLGMSAMHMQGSMRYDPLLFTLSIIIAVVLSYASIRIKNSVVSIKTVSEVRSMILAAIMMGTAISAMHYTGMAAMYYFPELDHTHAMSDGIGDWDARALAELLELVVPFILLLMIGSIHLSRRIEILKKLQDVELRQQSIVKTMVDGLVVIDDRGIIESFNPAAEKLFGYSQEEIIGENVNRLMNTDEAAQHDGHLAHFKTSTHSPVIGVSRIIKGRRKDGTLFPVDIALSDTRVEGKIFFTGVIRDISERLEAEEKLHTAKQAAEKASAAKSEFLARVSHELRTPMNAILGFGQLLEMDAKEFNESHQHYISELQLAGHRLLGLINDVLDLSQIETGKLTVNLESVLLDDVVKASINEVEAQAEHRAINIIDKIEDKDLTVVGNNERLKQVLSSLLSNGIKHNKEAGQVFIGTSIESNGYLKISVTDTGPGLTEEQIENIFKPFSRQNKNQDIQGVGVGLAISKHLIEIMGGRLGVESKLNVGSTFWVELSLADINKKNIQNSSS